MLNLLNGSAAALTIAVASLAMPVAAEDVGIQFDDMEVGTRLLTRNITSERLSQQEYLGIVNGFHALAVGYFDEGGTYKEIATQFYDDQGRQVREERQETYSTFEPFSCSFVMGACTHSWTYPNSLQAETAEYFTKDAAYNNRIEDDQFIVSITHESGSTSEIIYVLGEYNFRVSSRRTSARGGSVSGYDFVAIEKSN